MFTISLDEVLLIIGGIVGGGWRYNSVALLLLLSSAKLLAFVVELTVALWHSVGNIV